MRNAFWIGIFLALGLAGLRAQDTSWRQASDSELASVLGRLPDMEIVDAALRYTLELD